METPIYRAEATDKLGWEHDQWLKHCNHQHDTVAKAVKCAYRKLIIGTIDNVRVTQLVDGKWKPVIVNPDYADFI